MSERQHVSIMVEGLEYEGESWTAKGQVQFVKSGRIVEWTASHKKTIIVRFETAEYPDYIIDQVKQHIKSTLGLINLPYSRSCEIKVE